jgi:hypothetical protein
MKEDSFPAICIAGFFAKSNKTLSELFSKGHAKVITDLGLGTFFKHEDYWHNSDLNYIILAYSDDIPLGGIRLEYKEDGVLLPCEKILKPFEPECSKVFSDLDFKTYGEACNLWNDKIVANKKLGLLLGRTLIAIAPEIGINTVVSLNGRHTFGMARNLGSRIVREIGDNGYFKFDIKKFENENWSSALFVNSNLEELSFANIESKQKMFEIRENKIFRTKEQFGNSEQTILYNLKTRKE